MRRVLRAGDQVREPDRYACDDGRDAFCRLSDMRIVPIQCVL